MQVELVNNQQSKLSFTSLSEPDVCTCRGPKIDPMMLAKLNFNLFRQLRRLGTSKERICQALNLSSDDYDAIRQLR